MMALFDFLGTDTLKIVSRALIYTTAKYRKPRPSPPWVISLLANPPNTSDHVSPFFC